MLIHNLSCDSTAGRSFLTSADSASKETGAQTHRDANGRLSYHMEFSLSLSKQTANKLRKPQRTLAEDRERGRPAFLVRPRVRDWEFSLAVMSPRRVPDHRSVQRGCRCNGCAWRTGWRKPASRIHRTLGAYPKTNSGLNRPADASRRALVSAIAAAAGGETAVKTRSEGGAQQRDAEER